jgi:hypothetical protein
MTLGTAAVLCDQLVIMPQNVTVMNSLTAFRIVASQVPAITLTSENVSSTYQGLNNTALGNAALEVSGTDLIVTNLGSSGQDGEAVALPANLTGLTVNVQPLDVSNTLPVGAYVQSQLVGAANGVASGVLGTVTTTKAGTGNYAVSADFSALGASNYTVQAFYQGALVAQTTGQSGESFGEIPNQPTGWDWEGCPTSGTNLPPCDPILTLNGNPWFMTLGTAAVTCDQLVITPDNVAGPIVPTAFQIVASQVPSITINSENESLEYQGITSTSLGNATLAAAGNQLVVSNLGTNGQGGIQFGIQDSKNVADGAAKSQAVEGVFQPLDNSNTVPVGGYIQSQIVGTANDITNGILGTLTQTKAGKNNYEISADFTPMGASTYTVQAYDQGVLVGQAANQSATSMIGEPAFSTGLDFEISSNYIGWTEDFASGTSIMLGGQAVTCDQLEFIPDNVPLPSGVTGFQILASQVPSLTLTSVAVSPLLISMGLNHQTVTLQWYGTSVLQESTNLLTIWTDITNAFSPYADPVPATGPSKFYRLVFHPSQ